MKTVLEYLEKSTKKHSEKVAVIDENGKYTYKELEKMSKKIGTAISEKFEARNPVPVLMEKGRLTLATFFGAAYAGCFYVLLNSDLPKARLEHIMEVLGAKYLITDKEHFGTATELINDKSILLIEDLQKTEVNQNKLDGIRGKVLDIDPLYANFTSGSTGVPKGVLVSHHSVMDFIDNFTEIFGINNEDIIANQAPFDFDVSVKDIYSAISQGATLVIVPKKLFSLPAQLLDFLCENRVTTMVWAVSALCLITTFHALDYKTPETVNKILFSGEVMPIKHLKQWIAHLPNAMFVNLYGPTEITCNCTYHIVDKTKEYEKIPVGNAFPNEEVFLLDENDKLVRTARTIGEICVRGVCLALGYFNNKEQTLSRFVQNPLNDKYIDIIYRTGDLGEYDEDGELYFLGRKDFQIKHMGHRIELEEIERAMEQVQGVERGCCIFDEHKGKINGFYVGNIEKTDVIKYLRENLPVFMVPNTLTKIDKFPITKNGKIDRKELALMLGGKK